MAYFSNGAEGADFKDRWCVNCRRYVESSDGRGWGCPIWDAHLLFNDHKNKGVRKVLDALIADDGTAQSEGSPCVGFVREIKEGEKS